MISGIFNALTFGFFKSAKKKPTREEFAAEKRRLMANPEARRFAEMAGNSRRLAAHRRSCLAAYECKLRLANNGKGRNGTGGIPSQHIHS
jgi:hypothetical protein